MTIPTDNVDDAVVARPRRWNIDVIRAFMFLVGPISSLPFTPLGAPLGFVPLPGPYFLFLAGATATYLVLV